MKASIESDTSSAAESVAKTTLTGRIAIVCAMSYLVMAGIFGVILSC